MQLIYTDKRFVFHCPPGQRRVPLDAKFIWDEERRYFYTTKPQHADTLKAYASAQVLVLLDQVYIRQWDFPIQNINYPSDLTPRRYQLEDAQFALTRNRSYLACDPGLGKTIEAILVHNSQPMPIIYLCPPFLTKNVAREIEEWSTAMMEPKIATGKTTEYSPDYFHIVPDSFIHVDSFAKDIRRFAKSHQAMLVVDEAHRYKSADAKRTKNLFRFVTPLFNRVIFLSGTPMPNRVFELFMPLARLAPETIAFRDAEQFAFQYCDGSKDAYGNLIKDGSSNLGELFENIQIFMRRRKKKDVLKELPPKTEEKIYLPSELPADLKAVEDELLLLFDPDEIPKVSLEEAIAKSIGVDALELSTYRKELGLVKAPGVATFVLDILKNTSESVLLFAVHKEVIKTLCLAMEDYKPSVITGATPMAQRQALVDRLQNGDTRLLIGNIQACGVGFNLTKATRIVFAEFSWVPGDNDQAIDRAHRIGQHGNVHAQYMMFSGSLDERVFGANMKKRKVIEQL